MALLELSVITGTLAQMGLEKAFDGLNRREAVIRARKRIGMAAAPDPGNYQAIYRHALVEWGISKPEPVLDFFRDQRIYDAFIRSYQRGDPTILRNEAAEVVHWAEEYGAFRGLEYDPRRELLAFTATFEEVVDYARTAVEVRQDLALARLEQRLDEIQRLLAQLQAGQIAIGDIHLSGDFSGSIVNLLSQLGSATQTVAPVRQPPSLPPLDERGRPPLPDPGPCLPATACPTTATRSSPAARRSCALSPGQFSMPRPRCRRSSARASAASARRNWRSSSPIATAATSTARIGSAWPTPTRTSSPPRWSPAAWRWASGRRSRTRP